VRNSIFFLKHTEYKYTWLVHLAISPSDKAHLPLPLRGHKHSSSWCIACKNNGPHLSLNWPHAIRPRSPLDTCIHADRRNQNQRRPCTLPKSPIIPLPPSLSLSSHSSSVHEDQAEAAAPVPLLAAALRSTRAAAIAECIT
jgi:hypothetical protein